jgi:phosphoribosylanthranilate isomerase
MNQPNPMDLARLFSPVVDAFILDTIDLEGGRVGGTGMEHDWQLSRDVAAECTRPVILAGGLHAGNVREAIRIVRPFGVDANSKLKDATGYKDPAEVAAFVTAARGAVIDGSEAARRAL